LRNEWQHLVPAAAVALSWPDTQRLALGRSAEGCIEFMLREIKQPGRVKPAFDRAAIAEARLGRKRSSSCGQAGNALH
jgi:hypothetical protein